MAIQKRKFSHFSKENIKYTIIPDNVIKNIKSPLAFSIWSYLLSMPESWTVNKDQIMDKFCIGNGRLKSILSYLRRSNLLVYVQNKDKRGRLLAIDIHILCGDRFDESVEFKDKKCKKRENLNTKTSGSNIRTTGTFHEQKDGRTELRTNGDSGLYNIYNNIITEKEDSTIGGVDRFLTHRKKDQKPQKRESNMAMMNRICDEIINQASKENGESDYGSTIEGSTC